MKVQLLHGDCRTVLQLLLPDSLDACVTDPPYHLTEGKKGTGFMGRAWDGGDVAFQRDMWAEVFRVLKPGAHLLAFRETCTYHRMACDIEDVGFEIRDCVRDEQGREVAWPAWVYGRGVSSTVVPLGPPVSRMITGAQWHDQSATPKLAWDSVVVARKPVVGAMANTVLEFGKLRRRFPLEEADAGPLFAA